MSARRLDVSDSLRYIRLSYISDEAFNRKLASMQQMRSRIISVSLENFTQERTLQEIDHLIKMFIQNRAAAMEHLHLPHRVRRGT